jgi:alpha-tubulin suppressor-like RCC1 family protein
VREARAFSDWAFLDVGGDTACAIRADRSLWCWGKNVDGTTGVGTWTPVYEPTQVGTDKSWVRVSVGQAHACGIKQDESAVLGPQLDGQVGDDTYVNQTRRSPSAADRRPAWATMSQRQDRWQPPAGAAT